MNDDFWDNAPKNIDELDEFDVPNFLGECDVPNFLDECDVPNFLDEFNADSTDSPNTQEAKPLESIPNQGRAACQSVIGWWPCDPITGQPRDNPFDKSGDYLTLHEVRNRWPHDSDYGKKRKNFSDRQEGDLDYKDIKKHRRYDRVTGELLPFGIFGSGFITYDEMLKKWPYDYTTGKKSPIYEVNWENGTFCTKAVLKDLRKELHFYKDDTLEGKQYKEGDRIPYEFVARNNNCKLVWGPGTNFRLPENAYPYSAREKKRLKKWPYDYTTGKKSPVDWEDGTFCTRAILKGLRKKLVFNKDCTLEGKQYKEGDRIPDEFVARNTRYQLVWGPGTKFRLPESAYPRSPKEKKRQQKWPYDYTTGKKSPIYEVDWENGTFCTKAVLNDLRKELRFNKDCTLEGNQYKKGDCIPYGFVARNKTYKLVWGPGTNFYLPESAYPNVCKQPKRHSSATRRLGSVSNPKPTKRRMGNVTRAVDSAAKPSQAKRKKASATWGLGSVASLIGELSVVRQKPETPETKNSVTSACLTNAT